MHLSLIVGCPIDHQSKTVIKNGDFARVSVNCKNLVQCYLRLSD
jgi:hypothetical protein